MKVLKNIWVTTGLCAVAAIIVLYQLLHPTLYRLRARSQTAAPPAALTGVVAGSTNAAIAPLATPLPQPMDTQYAQAHLEEWLRMPRRDPFLLLAPIQAKRSSEKLSVVSRLQLNGIWRQTGGRIAAINNKIYAEGDVVEGYRIERIDADQVWFAGPDRNERLRFEKFEVRVLLPEGTNTLSTLVGGKQKPGGPPL